MLALKQLRHREKGFPDLLPYAALWEDGIVLNKDGSLMAGWFYRGIDTASATNTECNSFSTELNQVLSRLGDGWMAHIDAVRVSIDEYPGSDDCHFVSLVPRLIDDSRRELFTSLKTGESSSTHYDTVFAIVLTYLPPLERTSRILHSFYENQSVKERNINRTVNQFKEVVATFESHLSGVVSLQRMQSYTIADQEGNCTTYCRFLQYLHYCISGQDHPIVLPPCPMFLDGIIGDHEFYGGLSLRLDELFMTVVAISGFPGATQPGMLSTLTKFPHPLRWNTRFIFLDPQTAKSQISKYRRKWLQLQKGFGEQFLKSGKGAINQDAVQMVHDTDSAFAEASSDLVRYGYYTSVVILSGVGKEELIDQARKLIKSVQQIGFSARIETVNACEAYLGSLPGHSQPNIRRPALHTTNLADLMPVHSSWTGEALCPNEYYPPNSPPLLYAAAEGDVPFRLNLHVGTVGHTLIFGKTGGGKSTLLSLIMAQHQRYNNACVYAFDKGKTLKVMTLASEGSFYELGNPETSFAPFAALEPDAPATEVAWCREWIEMLCNLQNLSLTPPQRHQIGLALTSIQHKPVEERTLFNVWAAIQDQQVKGVLDYYRGGGPGEILDGQRDSFTLDRVQTFEMGDLLQLGNKIALPVLLHIFHRIESSLRGQPAIILLDEAWALLSHPVFRAKITEWLRTLRKYNCNVVMATQSATDIMESDGLHAILQGCCSTLIFLGNPDADQPVMRELYYKFGLNPNEVSLIRHMHHQYYVVSSLGKQKIHLKLDPFTLAFVGAGSPMDIATIDTLYSSALDEWLPEWLRYKGIYNADTLKDVV
jgi:type IV secretion system protein TrbE